MTFLDPFLVKKAKQTYPKYQYDHDKQIADDNPDKCAARIEQHAININKLIEKYNGSKLLWDKQLGETLQVFLNTIQEDIDIHRLRRFERAMDLIYKYCNTFSSSRSFIDHIYAQKTFEEVFIELNTTDYGVENSSYVSCMKAAEWLIFTVQTLLVIALTLITGFFLAIPGSAMGLVGLFVTCAIMPTYTFSYLNSKFPDLEQENSFKIGHTGYQLSNFYTRTPKITHMLGKIYNRTLAVRDCDDLIQRIDDFQYKHTDKMKNLLSKIQEICKENPAQVKRLDNLLMKISEIAREQKEQTIQYNSGSCFTFLKRSSEQEKALCKILKTLTLQDIIGQSNNVNTDHDSSTTNEHNPAA